MTTDTAPAAPAVPTHKPLDEFGKMALGRLIDTVNQYNGLAAQLKAATGDPLALLDNLRETYRDDANVAKISDAIDEIDTKREALWAKRDEILAPIVEAKIAEAKGGLGDSEAVSKELLKTVNASRKYITDLFGEGALADVPKALSTRVASGGTDGRSGTRIRGFNVFVDGKHVTQTTKKDGKDVVSSNLAVAAKHLNVDTSDMRELFQAAAKTTDPKAYPALVEFTISTGEGDARKMFTVRCEKVKDEAEAAAPAAPAAA